MLTRSLLAPGRSRAYLAYALVGRHTVHGWLSDLGMRVLDAADAIQRCDGLTGPVAEIGVHYGRSFIALSLTRRDDESAVAIDLFADQHLNVDSSGFGDRAKFEKNLQRWHPRRGPVQIVQADSTGLVAQDLRRLASGPLRLISIDGGHTVDVTRHDLQTATGALVEGGIVILDDFFNEFFPSVNEGTHLFFEDNPEFAVFVTGGNKTLICHADRVETYARRAETLLSRGPIHCERRTFLGRQVIALENIPELTIRLGYWRRHSASKLRSLAGASS